MVAVGWNGGGDIFNVFYDNLDDARKAFEDEAYRKRDSNDADIMLFKCCFKGDDAYDIEDVPWCVQCGDFDDVDEFVK